MRAALLLLLAGTALAAEPRSRTEAEMVRELVRQSTPAGLENREPAELCDEVERGKPWDGTLHQWSRSRDHLSGLPFFAHEERVGSDAAQARAEVGAAVRLLEGRNWREAVAYLALVPRGRQHLIFAEGDMPKGTPEVTPEKVRQHYAPALDYAFQRASSRVRMKLVQTLAAMPGADGPLLAARRAVFDTSPDVREAAVNALAKADPALIRPTFLAALRYPLPAAADHAALALVELKDRGAVPHLRALLSQPSPDVPYRAPDDRWVKRSVVSIDRQHNCLLCHRPRREKGRTVPDPTGHLLRPDFSVTIDPGLGQRQYDFVTRVRPLSDDERKQHLIRRAAPPPPTYPQREAVRFAIKHLGK